MLIELEYHQFVHNLRGLKINEIEVDVFDFINQNSNAMEFNKVTDDIIKKYNIIEYEFIIICDLIKHLMK